MITRFVTLLLPVVVLTEAGVINTLENVAAQVEAAQVLPRSVHRVKRQEDDDACQQADIALVLDSSGSIGSENWLKVLDFTKTMVLSFPVGPNDVRFSVSVYGNRADIAFNLNTYNTTDQYLAAIDLIRWKDQATNTSGAIRVMHEQMFTEANGDRAGVPNLGIIVTDGASNRDEHLTLFESDRARNKGITMFALGIGDETVQEELYGIGNDPPEEFVFEVEDFDALDQIQERLATAACEAAAACSFSSDLVLVFDSSGSIGNDNFENMKNFVAEFIEDLNVTPDETHVGVVTFSDNARVEFNLSVGVESRQQVMDLIDAIPYTTGTTNTADALRVAREDVFGEDGDRDDIPNVLVLFTDGGADDYEDALTEAIQTRLDGITVLVVAIGKWVNSREIYEMATDPDADNVFTVDDIDAIPSIRGDFKATVCNDRDDCAGRPCRNGGTCFDGINTYLCQCPEDYAGPRCDIPCSNPKDIAIALDSSDSISNQDFYAMQDFVKGLARSLPLSETHSRLSVEIYADSPAIQFLLDTYQDKQEYINAMSFWPEKGGTNTGEALEEMREEMFDVGDRASAENVGLVITDGGSSNRQETWQGAMDLRADGIRLLAVGVGAEFNKYNELEMKGIASDPQSENLFFSEDYSSLTPLNTVIVEAICNEQDDCDDDPCDNGQCIDLTGGFYCQCDDDANGYLCDRDCERELDLVFLVDTSGSIRRSRFYDIFKVFVKNITANMDVRPEAVRIGLLTFGDDAVVEWYLDDYSSREDVMQAIEKVNYRRGRTNMADALRLAREDMFTNSRGARDDVRDVIIMITDGKATVNPEDTLPEAIETRLQGINIVVVAAEQKDTSLELKGIASDPDAFNLFAVDRFQFMSETVDSVVSATCNSVNECDSDPCQNGADCVDELGYYYCECEDDNTGRNCERDCSARWDVVFVLDVSGSVESEVDLSLEFAKEVIQGLNFDGGRTRVGVVTFSTDAEEQFLLNRYSGKLSVLNAIAYMQDRGGRTNIADALELTGDDMFSTSNGGRSGDPDVVILVTDGNANVNEEDTLDRAEDLKDDGVRLLVVGVGDGANTIAINDMASEPKSDNTYFVEEMSEIEDTASDVLDQLCQ